MENSKFIPWNRGKSLGQKKSFSVKQISLLKELLETKHKYRDLVLLSIGVDTMLRSVDLLNLTVEHVTTPNGEVREEFQVLQKKTGKGNTVCLNQNTQRLLKKYLEVTQKGKEDYLFCGERKSKNKAISRYHYADIVKNWAKMINIANYQDYSTHSIRRTKASYLFEKTGNIEVIRQLLGQKSISSTSHYLGVSKRNALNIAMEYDI